MRNVSKQGFADMLHACILTHLIRHNTKKKKKISVKTDGSWFSLCAVFRHLILGKKEELR